MKGLGFGRKLMSEAEKQDADGFILRRTRILRRRFSVQDKIQVKEAGEIAASNETPG